MPKTMSPSSRGLIPGLFLALLAAFAVLTLNNHWLLPAVDDDGVAYLVAAPQMAGGEVPDVPLRASDAEETMTGLEGRGTAMPLLMATLARWGARPHVAALWVLGLSAALVLLSVAWVGGGVAGVPGALACGLALAASPVMVASITAVRPEILVMALVGLQLGAMTYRPAWSPLHGVPAALAWLAHPVGVGSVAAAVVWPLRASLDRGAWTAAALAAAPSVLLLALSGLQHGVWAPPAVLPELARAAPAAAAAGLLQWAGAGLAGGPAMLLGVVTLLGAAAVVRLDAGATPVPRADVHWSDPAAADVLAATLRPAAAMLALGLAAAAAASTRTTGGLAQPWAATAVPVVVLTVSAAVRRVRAGGGAASLLPAAALVVWMSVSSVAAVSSYRQIRGEGRGHTAAKWVASDVIRWVDNRSDAYPVLYASDPGLILLQTGRAAVGVPASPEKHAAFVSEFRADPGPVVLSGDAVERAGALAAELGLEEIVRTPEGSILLPQASG